MKIRGVNMHHDLGALGTAVNYRAIERQVQILQGHGRERHPHGAQPARARAARHHRPAGVLVLDEAFDTWTTDEDRQRLRPLLQPRGRSRTSRRWPSGIATTPASFSGASATRSAARRRRPRPASRTGCWRWTTRGRSPGPRTRWAGPHVSEGDDRNVAKLLDVAGYNYAPYAGDYDADHSANPTWKIMGTETSAAVRSRGIYHTPAATITKATSQSSADRQCSSYDNEAAGFGDTAQNSYSYDASRAFVAGSFIWAGFDYIGEPTPYSSWPSKSSYYGAIDTAGFPKDVYYFYKSRWTTAPMVHILPHWNWSAGTTVTVYVYNNCDSVELFLNNASQGSKTMSGSTLRARVERRLGVGHAARRLQASAAASSRAIRSRPRAPRRSVALVGGPDHDQRRRPRPGLRHRRHPGRERRLRSDRVAIRSASRSPAPASWSASTTAIPIDTASYKGTSRNAFSGKVLAIVRSTGTAGTITDHAPARRADRGLRDRHGAIGFRGARGLRVGRTPGSAPDQGDQEQAEGCETQSWSGVQAAVHNRPRRRRSFRRHPRRRRRSPVVPAPPCPCRRRRCAATAGARRARSTAGARRRPSRRRVPPPAPAAPPVAPPVPAPPVAPPASRRRCPRRRPPLRHDPPPAAGASCRALPGAAGPRAAACHRCRRRRPPRRRRRPARAPRRRPRRPPAPATVIETGAEVAAAPVLSVAFAVSV